MPMDINVETCLKTSCYASSRFISVSSLLGGVIEPKTLKAVRQPTQKGEAETTSMRPPLKRKTPSDSASLVVVL